MAIDTISAGVIIVMEREGIWYFLLLEAYGFWDFPKGIVEKGEEEIKTALREVEEETGIKPDQLEFLWGYESKDSRPYRGGRKIARYFIAKSKTDKVFLPVSPELGKPEHDSFGWFTYEEAKNKVGDRVRPILEWAYKIINSKNVK